MPITKALEAEAPHLLTLIKALAARFEMALQKDPRGSFPGKAYLAELQATIKRAEKPDPAPFYRCPVCGSHEVEYTAWVDAETDRPTDTCGDDDSVWCRSCENHSSRLLMANETPEWPGCADCGAFTNPDDLDDDGRCPNCAERQAKALASRE